MTIQVDDVHEGRFLTVDHGEKTIELDIRLIESLDNRYILRPVRSGGEDGILKYNVSLCESIRGYLTNRKMDRTELVGFLAQLKSVIRALEDHMLTDANILLDPEHVYIDRVTRKVRFVPVCRLDGTFSERLRPLIEMIFCHADMEDTESLRFAAKMMRTVMAGHLKMHTLMELADTSPSVSKQEHRVRQQESYAGTGEEVTVLLTDMGKQPRENDAAYRNDPAGAGDTGDPPAGSGLSARGKADHLSDSEGSGGHGMKGFFSNLASRFRDEDEDDE